jgi:hypothetical protein
VLHVLGREAEVRDALTHVVAERSGIVPFMAADPIWEEFRRMPWFRELLVRNGVG